MIVSTLNACTGLVVMWQCADGSVLMLNFPSKPADLTAACQAVEAELMQPPETLDVILEGENGGQIEI